MADIFGSLIKGVWHRKGERVADINPSDISDVVGHMVVAEPEMVPRALEVARAAQSNWAESGLEMRKSCLDGIGAELMDRADEIGKLLSREEGKPLAEGRGEVYRAGQFYQYYGAECLRQIGESAPSIRPNIHIDIGREPLGVVGLITPWNFPIAIAAWKMAPALAYGNTVVLKPSELTPATSWALAEIVNRHVPKGVFNMLMGDGAIGAQLAASSGLDGISFTGSVATGRQIAQAAISHMTRLQMEMGSKNAIAILNDANMELAVDCAVAGAYGASGQKCTAASRLIVEAGVYDEFVEKFTQAAQVLKVGDALAEGTQIGPVVSEQQMLRILHYVDVAQKEGATLAFGGAALSHTPKGYYVPPTLFVNTHNHMRLNREEVFGPVTAIIKADDYDQALNISNDTDFGLSSAIITSSLKYASHFKRHSRSGCVLVNLPTAGLDYHVPFGGRKASSYGPREQGQHARDFYTILKTAYTNPG